ncbi:MAG: GGDEF domain-containing response regulator [Prochlorothrix sp.]
MTTAPATVLIIDDTPVFVETLEDILSLEGLQVLKAYDGVQGVQLAQEHLPDLVLCDIMMPEMDGYQVLEHLAQHPETAIIPLVFITAKASPINIRQGMHLGANDYITKPYTLEDVLATVRIQLKKSQAIRQAQHQSIQQLQDEVTQLNHAASRDALTQVLNRRGLEEILSHEIDRFQRYRTPLSLILCDLDHFKKINDTHGHPAGDRILQEVAQLLLSAVRQTDFVCRWGGEEFLVLAPGVTEAEALILAEKLWTTVERYYANQDITVTLSLGVAEFCDHEDRADDCVKRADLALYQAKAQGCNRCQRSHSRTHSDTQIRGDTQARGNTQASPPPSSSQSPGLPDPHPHVNASPNVRINPGSSISSSPSPTAALLP